MKKILLLLLLSSAAGAARGEVRLPAIFGSGMVLQQQREVALWGTAAAGATVFVAPSWRGDTLTAAADSGGRWRLALPTGAAGGPYALRLSDGGAPLVLEDVLVGEVWLCGGQSNMEMPLRGYRGQPTEASNRYIVRSRNPRLRCITAPRAAAAAPQREWPRAARWLPAAPEHAGGFSAAAYHFGRWLSEVLGVPVGLVCVSYGGSQAESWMAADMLKDFPEIKIPRSEEDIGERNRTPTALYNAMLHPVAGFGVRGCIWYQGESNYERPDQYERLLPALVAGWRRAWGAGAGDFPFYYAQIAPFGYAALPPHRAGGKYNSAFLREAQRRCEGRIAGAAMAVLLDVGEERCIHPAAKPAVGERLALLALAGTYGVAGFASASPRYAALRVSHDTAVVTFEGAPLGLTTPGGRAPALFELAGADRRFHPAQAVVNAGKYASVTLTSPEVPQPVAARYAFRDFVVGDLFSTEGLPVSSFRTDEWEE
jgi:sialate O-acetylesterase